VFNRRNGEKQEKRRADRSMVKKTLGIKGKIKDKKKRGGKRRTKRGGDCWVREKQRNDAWGTRQKRLSNGAQTKEE